MKKEIKSWITNYLHYEIIQNRNRPLGQRRYFITTGDLILGIIWFPFFILWKIVSFPFKIKIFK